MERRKGKYWWPRVPAKAIRGLVIWKIVKEKTLARHALSSLGVIKGEAVPPTLGAWTAASRTLGDLYFPLLMAEVGIAQDPSSSPRPLFCLKKVKGIEPVFFVWRVEGKL